MKRVFVLLFAVTLFVALPGLVMAQGTTGTGTFGGTVPLTFSITGTDNASLAGTLGTFSTLTIGKSTMNAPTPMAFRLRSNGTYKLSAAVTAVTTIVDGTASPDASTSPQAIKTGDIGFGFTSAVVQNGVSVVGGGTTPTRTDTIVTGYDATAGWPTTTDGHTPAFTKTLHDIYAGVQILSGDRISSSGDNSSDDNYLTATLGVAAMPQYWTPGAFSGTVTLTIATTP